MLPKNFIFRVRLPTRSALKRAGFNDFNGFDEKTAIATLLLGETAGVAGLSGFTRR
jgi:hypothetical protein